jgi:cell division protease FtsH
MRIFLLVSFFFVINGFISGKNTLNKSKFVLRSKMLPSSEITSGLNNKIGEAWSYSDLFEYSKDNMIHSLTITEDGKNAFVLDNLSSENGNLHMVRLFPDNLNNLIEHLIKHNINFDIFQMPKNEFLEIVSKFGEAVFNVGIYFLAISLIVRIFSGMSSFTPSGGGNPLNPLQSGSNINEIDSEMLETTFDDVAGCEESKFELMEVVDFLKNKDKYEKAGAKVPKGVLLEGPPGTGKTLLARAVAGEAKVPFLSVSGSEFIEVYVGVGASRVRELFNKAKRKQPCVIFIDEIDAVGRKRGAGIAGGNDEREQTLNQILTNMDGFSPNEGIVVIAATNRIDILDQALTRPGRFDRKVKVGLPDIEGRKAIMKVHFGNKNISSDVDLNELASLTSGFSGADIANLANEAAIFSVRKNSEIISREHILDAYEKITIGLVSNTQTANKEIIDLVSNHEIGHAYMVGLFKDMFDLRKVTINENKSGAGGYTLFTPKERYQKYPTKKFMLANLIVALGGRAAEVYMYRKNNQNSDKDSIFSCFSDLEVTTGASNDLKQATNIARSYITDYGFGQFLLSNQEPYNSETPFMGRDFGIDPKRLSDSTKYNIDMQVNELLEFAFNQSYQLIEKNENKFIKSVELLKEKRIISGEDIYDIIDKKENY